MSNYINLAEYLRNELELEYPNKFEVTEELNNDATFKKTGVVVSQQAGNFYESAAEIPFLIEIYTENPKEVLDIFTKFGKDHNHKKILTMVDMGDGNINQYQVMQLYASPVVMESDIENFGLTEASRITMYARMFIMFDIDDIKTVEIDDESIDFLDISIAYTAEIDSMRESGGGLSEQLAKTSTTQIQMQGVNKNTIFGKKCKSIRQGKYDRNHKFKVVITYLDDSTEEYNMIVIQSANSSGKTKLPGFVVSLANTIGGE